MINWRYFTKKARIARRDRKLYEKNIEFFDIFESSVINIHDGKIRIYSQDEFDNLGHSVEGFLRANQYEYNSFNEILYTTYGPLVRDCITQESPMYRIIREWANAPKS